MRRLSIIGGAAFLACALLQAQDSPSFAKDIAPIFAANCAGCHGANVRMGSLSLDSYEGVEKGGNHGKIITIDVETGAYEMAEAVLTASDRLLAPYPDTQAWFVRIGARAVHRFSPHCRTK